MGRQRIDIDFNKIYTSNKCGNYKIIEELPTRVFAGTTRRMVKIQFIDTGYTADVQLPVALRGDVKDPYVISVLGVGCIGDTSRFVYDKAEYDLWYTMLRRCYSQKDPYYKYYGEIGVTVDKRWLCFENFLEDLTFIPGYNLYLMSKNNGSSIKYHLDKDFMQSNIPKSNRVYSKDTCCFIPNNYNIAMESLEYKRDHDCSSKYMGLYRMPSGNYQCTIMINGEKNFLGTFTDEIAAANAYNWYAAKYNHPSLNSNIPYMSPIEWVQYRSRAKLMCRVVDKK